MNAPGTRLARVLRVAMAGVAVALLSLALAACGSSGSAGSPSSTPSASPVTLKVMEFNIEYGGTLVDFDKMVAAIRAADPDIVGVEEADTSLPRLAKELGWYYDNGMQIISQVPDPRAARRSDGVYAFIEVQPGRVVALSNVHLPSDPYGPYWVRDGKPVDKVLAMETRVRLPALETQLEVLPGVAAGGMPVFVIGDFNAPSHLDWTEAAVGTRKYLKYAVEWPVSKALADAGFRDSYREAHPDPVATPGLTWWAARPKVVAWAGNPTRKDPRDRIDFVYAAGPATTISSEIVGERGGRASLVLRLPVAVRSPRRRLDLRGARTCPLPVPLPVDRRLATMRTPSCALTWRANRRRVRAGRAIRPPKRLDATRPARRARPAARSQCRRIARSRRLRGRAARTGGAVLSRIPVLGEGEGRTNPGLDRKGTATGSASRSR